MAELQSIFAEYPHVAIATEPMSLANAGGFSGAAFWRVTTSRGDLCLRRWPAQHPTPERLRWIHSVLRHAAEKAIDFLPVPLAMRTGASFVQQDGHLWELAPWLPGKADYHDDPSPEKLAGAMRALASFHQAVSDFPHELPPVAPSPGLSQRLEMLRGLRNGELERIRQVVRDTRGSSRADVLGWNGFGDIAVRLISLFEATRERIHEELSVTVAVPLSLQVCLRDIWHDHVLLTKSRVTGIVDFGAMRVDSVCGDIARLLGSLVEDEAAGWKQGSAAYESVRPLTAEERRLVRAFDRSSTLLAGMNWLRWIYLEGRHFEDMAAITDRLEKICQRLERFL
jgi:Ser/Thr protein kinase RdoA (MazF antagonist)